MSSQTTNAGLVQRNTLHLFAAQVVTVPLTVLTNILIARYLGPTAYGHLYLATTFATFAFLFVECGQGGALAGQIAADRQRAGELLGSSLAWRTAAVIPVATTLLGTAVVMGQPRDVLVAIAIMVAICAFTTASNACHDAMRGFERTDIGAITFVGWKLLLLAVTVPVLLTWNSLPVLLVAQAACAAIGALVMLLLLRLVKVRRLTVRTGAVRELLAGGWPFMALALVIALHESVDAAFLSRMASAESIGWYAAARRLVGLLIFPAAALIAALYPTLSRLRHEDQNQFIAIGANALRTTVLLATPLALGCLLFPELGVWVFDEATYGPVTADLRVLSPYVLLVYVSMPIGTVLMAGGRQRAWVVLQLLCVMLAVALDIWLIPLCELRFGNGGLGVCLSMLLAELVVIAGAVCLAPRRLFDLVLLRATVNAATGGGIMAGIALLLDGRITPWIAAPISLTAYALVLMALGAVHPATLRQMLAGAMPGSRRHAERTGTGES